MHRRRFLLAGRGAIGFGTTLGKHLFDDSVAFAFAIATTDWSQACFPAAEFVRYSSPFDPARVHPQDGVVRPHNGIDIAAPEGSDILAWWGGNVKKAVFEGGCGNTIVIQSGKWEHVYCHCQELLVNPGDQVKAGQIIGKVGSTGGSTGPHLHFETWHNGKVLNPARIFRAMRRSNTAPSESPTPQETKSAQADAVVTIYAGREIGSGSILSSHGTTIILTAAHVAIARNGERIQQVKVRLANGETFQAEAIASANPKEIDLAVLIASKSRLPTVQLDDQPLQTGDDLLIMGSPGGNPGAFINAVVSGDRPPTDRLISVTANPEIQHGISGGPVFRHGKQVGVIVGVERSDPKTGYAVRLSTVREFLQASKIQIGG